MRGDATSETTSEREAIPRRVRTSVANSAGSSLSPFLPPPAQQQIPLPTRIFHPATSDRASESKSLREGGGGRTRTRSLPQNFPLRIISACRAARENDGRAIMRNRENRGWNPADSTAGAIHRVHAVEPTMTWRKRQAPSRSRW